MRSSGKVYAKKKTLSSSKNKWILSVKINFSNRIFLKTVYFIFLSNIK